MNTIFSIVCKSKLLFLSSLLLFLVVAIIDCSHDGLEDFDSNQWEVEDKICDQLTNNRNNITTICNCVYGELNRLSILCQDENNDYDQQTLSKSIQQTLRILNDNSAQLDELVLGNLQGLESITFEPNQNLQLDTLRIVNCPELKSIHISIIETINNNETKFRTTLNTLEIVNTGLDSSIFKFIRQFSNLHTVLLSDIKFGSSSKFDWFNKEGSCSPIHRLALNHRCTSSQSSQIERLPNGLFADLCHVAVLELSCLGLTELEPFSLQIWPSTEQNSSSINVNSYTRKRVYIDLSHNRLSNLTKVIETLQTRPATSNIESIHLNLDHNKIILDWNVVGQQQRGNVQIQT